MPINGTDNYIDPEKKYSDSYSDKTFLDVVDDICKVYKKVLNKRKENNDFYTGFTLQEYNSNKDENDVSYFYILKIFGSWKKVVELLPIQNYHYNKNSVDDSIQKLYDILKNISSNLEKDMSKITVKDFDNYRNDHNDENIPGWRTFSRKIAGNDKWKSCVKEVVKYAETL